MYEQLGGGGGCFMVCGDSYDDKLIPQAAIYVIGHTVEVYYIME
jgi:hypothetical protein